MSLLDDVSIVVTPNGYKAGELYAVIPVPTEGAELVTNGDFATDSNWTKGTGWTISSGSANCDGLTAGATLSQSSILEVGKRYKLTFDIINYTSGVLILPSYYYQTEVNFNANGSYEVYVIPKFTNLVFYSNLFNGSIDNVSVKEYTAADMDVTRATAATRVDENGLVNYAEILGGEEVTDGNFPLPNTAWNLGTGWSVGDSKAVFSGSAFANLEPTVAPITSGKTYKVSLTAVVTNGSFKLQNNGVNIISENTSGSYTAYFVSGSTTFNIARESVGVQNDFTITNVSVKEVTRDNVPRIDYTGGGCPHILSEPQRTNLFPYSEDFTNGAWYKSNATAELSSELSPDGTLNAYKVTATDTNEPRVEENMGAVGVNTIYTFSFFAKEGNSSFVAASKFTGSEYAIFNLDTGVIVSSTTDDASITALDNGWFKVSITHEVLSTDAYNIWKVNLTNGTGATTGVIGEYVHIYGAQLEVGSYPTSLIPNFGTAAGVTRNQDIFTRDGISSLIGQTEGTFFIELSKPILSPDSFYLISLNNAASNSDNNSVIIGFESGSDDFYLRLKAGGSIIYVDDNRNSLADTFYKIAIAYKSGASLIYIDGSPITPNSGSLTGAFSFSETLDNLSFDYDGDNGFPFYGKVKQLQVYNTALTDAQLTSLTS